MKLPQRAEKKIIICEVCKHKFENFTRFKSGSKKKKCEDCIREAHRIANSKRKR